jgi:hypothetical protein
LKNVHWKTVSSPRPKIPTVKIKSQNVFLTFYVRGYVHYGFVPNGQIIDQVYYLEVLEKMRENVRRKRPERFGYNSWTMKHDNAPGHTSLSVRALLVSKQITVGTPCLLNYSTPPPFDFFLLPKVNKILNGMCFDIRSNTTAALKGITHSQFQNILKDGVGDGIHA